MSDERDDIQADEPWTLGDLEALAEELRAEASDPSVDAANAVLYLWCRSQIDPPPTPTRTIVGTVTCILGGNGADPEITVSFGLYDDHRFVVADPNAYRIGQEITLVVPG